MSWQCGKGDRVMDRLRNGDVIDLLAEFNQARGQSNPRPIQPLAGRREPWASSGHLEHVAAYPQHARWLLDGLLDCGVRELHKIGEHFSRQESGDQARRLRRENEGEAEGRRDPVREAERARQQLTDRVAQAIASDLLAQLRGTSHAVEHGEGRAKRAGDRLFRQHM
jgi:hypothetical protein